MIRFQMDDDGMLLLVDSIAAGGASAGANGVAGGASAAGGAGAGAGASAAGAGAAGGASSSNLVLMWRSLVIRSGKLLFLIVAIISESVRSRYE